MPDYSLRDYLPGDEATLAQLFFETIHHVNQSDYSLEQLNAWAPTEQGSEIWLQRIQQMNPIICLLDKQIVGYTGLLESGYVDHFYVHHQHQRRGVGRTLMRAIHDQASGWNLSQLTADVSITARPFFATNGFELIREQTVTVRSVNLTNYKMCKNL